MTAPLLLEEREAAPLELALRRARQATSISSRK